MKLLVQEREEAIRLRKKGYSYREILKEVPVAKSTLSHWLKNVSLTDDEKQYLKTRTDSNISVGRIRAASVHRSNRLKREKTLWKIAESEFEQFTEDPLFAAGVALYWAEGAKRSNMCMFTNSDEEMLQMMLLWLERFTSYKRSELGYRLYAHLPYAHENWETWWATTLGVDRERFKKTVYKPTNLGIKKRPNYKGCLRIEIPRSISLLRKMQFWQKMLVEQYSKQL